MTEIQEFPPSQGTDRFVAIISPALVSAVYGLLHGLWPSVALGLYAVGFIVSVGTGVWALWRAVAPGPVRLLWTVVYLPVAFGLFLGVCAATVCLFPCCGACS